MEARDLRPFEREGQGPTVALVNVGIEELMRRPVITVVRHTTAGHVRKLMAEQRISAVPVVDGDNHPVGIVTVSDLLDAPADGAHVSEFMSKGVQTVPIYDGPHVAARIMRNHRIHHVVVTHEKKVVGMLSTFDLLQLR